MLGPKCSTFKGRPTFANPMYHKKAQSGPTTRLIPDSEEILTLADKSRSKLNKDLVNHLTTRKNLPKTAMKAVRNTNVIKPGMYRIASSTTQTRAPQLNQTFRNTNPRASTSTGIAHKTNVSRPQPRSNQMKDKVVPYTSHAKLKKTEVEEHPRISSISNKTKSVTACNDSLNSRSSNANAVCATCGKCVFNLNHDACVSKFLNDVNARTKKPNVVPISTRKPKRQANKSVATPHKKTGIINPQPQSSKSYYRMLYQKTKEGIEHQTSTPRTPEQNGVVKRRNRTLVEAARTMLSASKLPLFFWAEAIATACYLKTDQSITSTHVKTDGENLDKMKEKGDSCILVGYSTQSKGYRVYNKRTRLIVESIHLRFDEFKETLRQSVA
ncbi:retrovirus-related pol polyprotein from transposon TNT 1-94 [Tanacetum coccineum]